jgi:hypothetical protein
MKSKRAFLLQGQWSIVVAGTVGTRDHFSRQHFFCRVVSDHYHRFLQYTGFATQQSPGLAILAPFPFFRKRPH